MSKKYDIVVFGATSFVGQLVAEYLCNEYTEGEPIKWAMAGRSQTKLNSLKERLGDAGRDLPVIVVDALDSEGLKAMCGETRVVMSTVGPFALYGETLVKACAETGTDYCDLTGEHQWVVGMIDRYEDAAKASGARIVHCCAFDSLPSDLGVHYTQELSHSAFNQHCTRIDMRVHDFKAGLSGGTLLSATNTARELAEDPTVREMFTDPYSMCPDQHGFTVVQDEISVCFDDESGKWVGPFMMEPINTRIVHRSNALSGKAYGENFRYSEGMLMGKGLRGRILARLNVLGWAAFFTIGGYKAARGFLEKYVLAQPGEGPSPEEQANGSFGFHFTGCTADGQVIRTKVTGDRDPGYGSSSKMIGQAAVCLAFGIPKDTVPGGFWTPATIFGDKLISRLQRHAGLSFDRID